MYASPCMGWFMFHEINGWTLALKGRNMNSPGFQPRVKEVPHSGSAAHKTRSLMIIRWQRNWEKRKIEMENEKKKDIFPCAVTGNFL
jgi:hypothetical protein